MTDAPTAYMFHGIAMSTVTNEITSGVSFTRAAPVAEAGNGLLKKGSELPTKKALPNPAGGPWALAASANRSEEHTSEFNSLMRISYSDFCFKKKIHFRSHVQLQ